jgi:predicted transposase/invertase (TIGR01784 family)
MAYKLNSPHDNYFCGIMEVWEVAHSFFIAHLPSALVDELDWDTLQLAESARRLLGSKTRYTDITYTCNTKKEGIPIFLHVEQQRRVDNTMLERILRYNLALYSKHRKQGHKKLLIVVSLLVYNNTKPRNYPYPEQISY